MKDKYKEIYQETLDRILVQLGKDAAPDLKNFVTQFYAKMPAMELQEIPPAEACAIAASAYEFLKSRTPETPKIRLFEIPPTPQNLETANTIEVLNDDMPFLVDSLVMELSRQGLAKYRLIHPILKVVRDKNGTLQKLAHSDEPGAASESFIHVEVSALPEGTTSESLVADIQRVLKTVRLAVADWQSIMHKVDETVTQLKEVSKHFKSEEVSEVRDFLTWLADRNFIFLGYIEYDFKSVREKPGLTVTPGSELGIFKIDDLDLKPKGLEALPPEVLHFALVPQLVEITKSNRKSAVHRPVHMDYIGIKRFNRDGEVIGERRFLGLFTSLAYYQSADNVPFIRRKVMRTLTRAGFDPLSHDGKALKAILEFFPRDELFQISEDDLFETSIGILSLESRPTVRVFPRKDAFERFVSCLVFVPRERFSTELREQIQKILEQAYNGTITAYYTQITESPLARLHLIVKTTPNHIPEVNIGAIEAGISKVTHLWSDLLRASLRQSYNAKQAAQLYLRYANAFPTAYINRYEAANAVFDIGKAEQSLATGTIAGELFHLKQDKPEDARLKIYNRESEIALSDILPVMENMGFRVIDEMPFFLTLNDASGIWIRDFRLKSTGGALTNFAEVKPLFEDALTRIWQGEIENDGFNALIVKSGLPWRDVSVLRAYAKYLKQVTFPYSQTYIEQALAAHPTIAKTLIGLFHARFDPARQNSEAAAEKFLADLETGLGEVTNLAEDRILRRYAEVIQATVRTNFYQRMEGGSYKPVISFKIDSSKVPELPLPRPFREIFVYSPRVEGIHLRGGKVARGGLRWSDRAEDFRTEILGLMKAQIVKNAVIVPVGSKGGFVLKRPPAASDREATMKEGIACYTLYLQGLLDITDNIVGGKIQPPPAVVRHDEDDPYLVVAADKGTATFSDIANSVSQAYQFWLDDAFASGGSAGYDHKAIAITARGGWISVERHFRELGMDINKNDFTTVGIGDMAGDVFGNGMLLSKHIKLVAAFNHMHIFLDPTPDAAKSFEERQRLFNLPRSTWKDYNPKLISKGGGVYERSAKFITLSKEAKAALDISADSITPDELIRAILLAPVDLLWNGGIGTYVKSEDQTHEEVGDRSNNAVRVNGKQLRCKVVGEGGNLGFTQKGRIEYARNGGKINTDAIDNSGGVDCSDHEVNIKIAFQRSLSSGRFTRQARDQLLVAMTEEVVRLVLRDNQLQTHAITAAEVPGFDMLDAQARLIQSLERAGLLDRKLENLPTDKQIAELKATRKGLTRPELAVLLAYSKISLYGQLVESDLPDNPYFEQDLLRYFPKPMQQNHTDDIRHHQLRREIIATVATNSLVNRTGMTFFQGLADDTGLPARDIVAAYTITRDAFALRQLWNEIEALDADPTVAVKAQVEMFTEINRFIEHMTLWFLRNATLPLDIESLTQTYTKGVQAFAEILPTILSAPLQNAFDKKKEHYMAQQVPQALAERIAGLEALSSACDIVMVAGQQSLEIITVGKVYFELGAQLELGWLRHAASKLRTDTHWNRLGVRTIINDLYDQQRRLTSAVIKLLCTDKQCGDAVAAWHEQHEAELKRYRQFIEDLKSNDSYDLAMLVVASQKIEGLSSV